MLTTSTALVVALLSARLATSAQTYSEYDIAIAGADAARYNQSLLLG
jgi:hypothetical protein